MSPPTFRSIRLDRILSFGPSRGPVELRGLNVLIGPNGSGKSNVIEAFELLRATPADLADFIRRGGGAAEWLWKGQAAGSGPAAVEAVLETTGAVPPLRYWLAFTESAQRLEVVEEVVEGTDTPAPDDKDVPFYYRFRHGHPVIIARELEDRAVDAPRPRRVERRLKREDLDPQQSVLSQRRDPDLYPEVTALAQTCQTITVFREWSFGRSVAIRQPQPADLPTDVLSPDLRNLGLVLNSLEHSDTWRTLNSHLRRFLPRFKHLSTRVQAGHVQIYLHEDGLATPVPATRLSDGTIRFIALMAILLRPEAASVICLEEPELGLHPDAVSFVASLLADAASATQLVVTTHSDGLVSALSEHADSVLVAEYGLNGTELTRLETEKLRFWLDKYRLGEIWRMGELGGNP